ELTVTEEMAAKNVGSGTLMVFATPAMIALMEKTAWESVQPELEEGSGTVGTALNVKHVAATPMGMKVTCETELIKVEGRALTFSIKAYDEAGLIGEGTHERFVVYNEKFQAKADAKRG
ncbi:MAG: thioesterase family protein, partial [Lachnospiraceae bacterium]|nr:thioesterase family protein [Lachnospiraceae bacterium]